jgi:ferredoxin
MNEAERIDNFINIYINNKMYKVPAGMTIMQAWEYSGYQMLRGCGCRGGVCGACATVYRMPGTYKIQTTLACQSLVKPDMSLIQIPSYPVNRPVYDLEKMETDTRQILSLYPEITRCMGCNTCTSSCPMDIDVMDTLSELIRGYIEKVSRRSISCVMCGLCAVRCPAGLAPYHYFLLCRRIFGRHFLSPFIDVSSRISEIENKKYESEMDKLVTLDKESLKEIYRQAQLDKRII